MLPFLHVGLKIRVSPVQSRPEPPLFTKREFIDSLFFYDCTNDFYQNMVVYYQYHFYHKKLNDKEIDGVNL